MNDTAGADISFTFETPFFGAGDHVFSQAGAVALGRCFVRALHHYDEACYQRENDPGRMFIRPGHSHFWRKGSSAGWPPRSFSMARGRASWKFFQSAPALR